MKKLFLLLSFAVCFVASYAQQPVIIPTPVRFSKWIFVHDTARIGSFVFTGLNDTLATRAYARGFAGGGLHAGYGIRVKGDSVFIDTSNYRKMDSLYVITDSTGIFKINGTAYSFKMRGALFSFNNRIGAILPQRNDYRAFVPLLDSAYEDPAFIGHLSFSKMISLPGSLAGYNITDGVQNGGNATKIIADAFSNRPAPGNLGVFFLSITDSILYYDNGLTWQRITSPAGTGTDSALLGGYGLLKTTNGSIIKLAVDTTTLKQVFGSGSPGVVQLFTKYGLIINGTDTASVDTTVFLRWKDTLTTIATRTYVNTRGFITSESDPVASAKTITIAPAATRPGIIIVGSAQTVGSNPSFTVRVDTASIATPTYVNSQGFIKDETDPVAQADTIQVTATPSAGILIAEVAKQLLGASPKWTFKTDTSLLATRYAMLHSGFISGETDPIATAKTVNFSTPAGSGLIVTGLTTQPLSGNPTWTIKADTNVLATKTFFLPLNFTSTQNILGNGFSLNLINGLFQVNNSHRITGVSGGGIAFTDSTGGIGGGVIINPTKGLNFYYGQASKGFVLANDSLTIWGDSTKPFAFTRAGNASFPGHVTGITESSADSSNNLISTAGVKRILAAYSPALIPNPVLNFVSDFGGDPTGVSTNDSAWARLSRASGVTVLFPKGVFKQTKALGFTGTKNVALIGLAGDSSRIVSEIGVKNNIFIGRNSKNMLIQGLYFTQKDTNTNRTHQNVIILMQSDTLFTTPNRDSTALTENITVAGNWLIGNGGNSICNGVYIISHRNGWGAYARNITVKDNIILNMGSSGGGALGEPDKKWMWDISVSHNQISHTGLVDTALGFAWTNSGQGSGMYIGHNHATDVTQIAFEQSGVSYSTTEENDIDSSFRNGMTCPYTFNATLSPTSLGNRAINNRVLDSIPCFPYILNQQDFYSSGNRIYAYQKNNNFGSSFLIDSVRHATFTGDRLIGTMTTRPTLYMRAGTSGVTWSSATIIGVSTQNQLVLVADTTSVGNLFAGCTFGGNLSDATLINYLRGSIAVVKDAYSLRSGVSGFTVGLPTTVAPATFIVKNSAGQQAEYPFGPLGVSRIAPVDSLSRVAKGLQIVGTTLAAQTANSSFVGFMSSAHWSEVDSLIRRLLVNSVKLIHTGIGKYSGYSSLLGDSLFLKNNDVTNDLTLTTRSDSSLLFGVNFNSVAGLTNTQTLANKTYANPILSSLSTSSDSSSFKPLGVDGSGATARMSFWPGSGGGGGSQNLSQVLTAISDSIKISGGTGFILPSSTSSLAGLMSAARTQRVDSTVYVGWTGKGKKLVRAPYTKDSLLFSGIGITASGGLTSTYTGTADSVSYNVAITALTTNGDLLTYNGGVTRLPMTGTDGMVLTRVSGLPVWQAISGTGTVTTFSTPGSGLSPLFTTSVANANSTPQLTFGLSNAAAHTFWGNFTGSTGPPSYSSPVLASADFANQGSTVQVLHGGGPSANPSWGPLNLATDATGTLPGALFPALSGDISTTAGSLVTTIGTGKVTNAMLAGSIDLSSKVTNTLGGTFGGTGANNAGKTIVLGGNLATSGAFPLTLTLGASTNLTLPSAGTVLTTTGSGAGLSGVVTSATGTANEIIVNQITGAVTFSTPQPIAAGSAPTFAGMTFTGLGTGAGTDNVLTIAGNVVRSTPASSILATANVQAGLWNPLLIAVNNIPSASIALNSACFYQRVGNIVHGSMTIQINPQPGNGQDFSIAVNVPVASAYSGSFNLHGVIVQAGSIPGDPAGYVVGDSNSGALMLRAFLHSSVNGGNGNGLYIEFTYIVQ